MLVYYLNFIMHNIMVSPSAVEINGHHYSIEEQLKFIEETVGAKEVTELALRLSHVLRVITLYQLLSVSSASLAALMLNMIIMLSQEFTVLYAQVLFKHLFSEFRDLNSLKWLI